jgi:peptidoglycan-associated lipoprotein
MKRSFFSLSCVIAISLMAFSIGCSKKITKVQTQPSVAKQAPVETPKPQPQVIRDSFETTPTDEDLKSILQPVYFDFNKYNLRPDALERLQMIGKLLSGRPTLSIVIEGNGDERGSAEYNMALGERRARAAKDWLSGFGIADSRMEVNSYGKERPAIANCQNDACHAKNRRDEFKVLAK